TMYTDLQIDDVSIDEARYEAVDVGDYKPFAFHTVQYLNTSQHTLRVRSMHEADATGKSRRVRLTAIRMTSDYDHHFNESNAESASGSTTYTDKVKLNFTISEAADYLVFATAEVGEAVASAKVKVTMDIDGVDYCENVHEPKETNSPMDYLTFACSKVTALSTGNHSATIEYAKQEGGTAYIRNARITAMKVTPEDLIDTGSVTGLADQAIGADWVYWNWTNPVAADFDKAIVYIDGVNVINTSADQYNATGLGVGSHTITVHTKDLYGNVNDTDVNDTAVISDVVVPAVQDLQPSVGTQYLTQTNITLKANVTDNGAIGSVKANVSWNSAWQIVDLTYNATSELYQGLFTNASIESLYNITIIANDSAGLVNDTEQTYFEAILQAMVFAEDDYYGKATIVDVSGIRFTENGVVEVEIRYPNATLVSGYPKNVSVDGYGILSDSWIVPLIAPAGIYTINADDQNNSLLWDNASFEVKDEVTIEINALDKTGTQTNSNISIYYDTGIYENSSLSPLSYLFTYGVQKNVLIAPDPGFELHEIGYYGFAAPNLTNYSTYFSDPPEDIELPTNVKNWSSFVALGSTFQNYQQIQAKVEHYGGNGVYMCDNWNIGTDVCSGGWIRVQSVIDSPRNSTIVLDKTFVQGNIGLGIGTEVVTLERDKFDYLSPKKQYTIHITLYNQMDENITDLVVVEDILDDWFLSKRAGNVLNVSNGGVYNETTHQITWDLDVLEPRTKLVLNYEVEAPALLPSEKSWYAAPLSVTATYKDQGIDRSVTDEGGILILKRAAPLYTLTPNQANATVDYEYTLRIENLGGLPISAGSNQTLEMPSVCSVNNIGDGGYVDAENVVHWDDLPLISVGGFEDVHFNMSCLYWSIMPLQSRLVGEDNQGNIDVKQTVQLEIVDVNVPNITDVNVTPSEVIRNFPVTITADITDDVLLYYSQARITYPNGTTSNFVMSLYTGDTYRYIFADTDQVGIYNYTIYAIDKGYNANESSVYSFTVLQDSVPPSWSGVSIGPSTPAVYVPGAPYQFNTTWTDLSGISVVLVEHNFTGVLNNYSITGNNSAEYYYDYTDLGVGSYVWRMYANDSQENMNMSDQQVYEVQKAGTTTQLYLNGSEANLTVVYGEAVNASADTSTGSVLLNRDGGSVSNPDLSVLGVGVYNYTAINDGDANYTGSAAAWFLTVQQATSSCSVVFDKVSPQSYGTQINVSCGCDNPEASVVLWRDGVDVTGAENDVLTLLAAGDYEYVCNVSASQNYTSASDSANYTIGQAGTTTTVYLNGGVSNLTVVYGVTTNASADTDNVGLTFYRDGTSVSNPEIAMLGAGYYNYSAVNLGDANYTGSSGVLFLTVDQAGDVVNLYLNGLMNQNVTITYGTQSNATGTSVSGTDTLYRDGVLVGDSDVGVMGAGQYTYTINSTGNQNYSANMTGLTYYLTVDQETTVCNLEYDQSSPVVYGTPLNASCSCTSPETGSLLWRDGSDVTGTEESQLIVFAAGEHEYVCNVTASQNYSAATNISNFTVDKASTTLDLTVGPSWSETYGTETTIACNASNDEVAEQLYRNGSLMGLPDVDTLGAGSYLYVCNATDTQNYTGNESQNILTIAQYTTSTSLFLNGSESNLSLTYGESVNASAVTSNLTLTMYRDGTPISNPTLEMPGAGVYNYTAANPGDANYTASAATWFLTVAKAVDELHLMLNGSESNLTVTYGESSNVSGTSVSGTETLYRDGVLVGYPDLGVLGVGQYEYRLNSSGNQNYTADASGVVYYLNVDQMTTVCSLTYDKASSQTYGTALNASCSCTTPESASGLFRDGSDVTGTEESQLIVLSAGEHEYICNVSASQNYTAAIDISNFTIYKDSTTLDLTGTPSWSETYGTQTSIACNASNDEVVEQLYQNGTLVGLPDTRTLEAGSYLYVCNASDTQNFTGNLSQNILTISKYVTTTQLFLNGSESNLTGTYGESVNVSAVTSNQSLTLLRDGTPISNPTIEVLGAGLYNYTAVNAGDENYTSSVATWFLTLNKASDTVTLLINGSAANLTLTYGETVNASALSVSGTEGLYRDSQGVANPELALLSAGSYVYLANSTGDANYTGGSDVQYTVAVNKAASAVGLLLNGTDSNVTIEVHNGVNESGVKTVGEGGIELHEEGVLVNTGAAVVENVTVYDTLGTFNVTVSYPETQNFSGSNETHWITVRDTTPPVVALEGPVNDTNLSVQSQDFTFSFTDNYYSNANCTLYIDDAPIVSNASTAAGISTDLTDASIAEGVHSWFVNCTEGSGNEDKSEERALTVDLTAPNITLVRPVQDDIVGYTMTIDVDVLDDLLDVKNVWYQILNTTGGVVRSGTMIAPLYQDDWNTTDVGDGQYIFVVWANDTVSNLRNDSANFTIDNAQPFIQILYPGNASQWNVAFVLNISYQNNMLNVTKYNITNSSGAVVQSNISVDVGANETWFEDPVNVAGLPDGIYSINAYTKDVVGYVQTEQTQFYVDKTVPVFSAVEEPSDPTVYAPGANYVFNSTWTDLLGIEDVIFEFDGVNYSDATQNGDEFTKTISDLAVGVYNYRWYANDTTGNSDATGVLTFTVTQADDPVELYLDGVGGNLTIGYGATVNATGLAPSGTHSLYRDGALVSNPEFIGLPAGVYEYKVNSTGSQNYTANNSGLTYYLTVDYGVSSCSLGFDKVSPQVYETQVQASCSCDSPEATAVLWRNGTDVTATENDQLFTVGVGVWDYVCNVTGTQNYTSASNTSSFTMTEQATVMSLIVSPSWSETYGTETTVNCSADNGEVTPQLYRNSMLVSISDV
ncbi:beta strand repeat-containing protein, partial [Nanoarchaeota archaeon]